MNNELLQNLDKLYTTPMGVDHIITVNAYSYTIITAHKMQ